MMTTMVTMRPIIKMGTGEVRAIMTMIMVKYPNRQRQPMT